MKKLSLFFLSIIIAFAFLSISYGTNVKISNWAKPAYNRLNDKQMIPLILRDKDMYQSITRKEFTHILMTYLVANHNYQLETYYSNFKDVQDDKYISAAYSLGIVSGYNDRTFRPLYFIKRSEAAVMMYNAEKLLGNVPTGSTAKLKDARFIQSWAKAAVGSMVQLGVMTGYEDGNFIPSRHISRQETVVMIDKLSGNRSSKLKDVFEIEKNDIYLSAQQYNFVLNNIPTKKFDKLTIKQLVFDTETERKIEIYKKFIKAPYTTNIIFTSPNLVFDYDKSTYILGIEKRSTTNGKTEMRTFFYDLQISGEKISSNDKSYSAWIVDNK